jgi:hypothetical protein
MLLSLKQLRYAFPYEGVPNYNPIQVLKKLPRSLLFANKNKFLSIE